MVRCLLLDIPSGALQAILDNLNPADHASLREVSRSVCERTTAHIPYISLLLTDNTDLLQQWHQATRSLQHVSNIHIHVVCDITAEVFDAAMQLLSERTSIRELHVLAAPEAVPHPISRRASIDTLLPLKHILPSLQTLVIRGIAMPDLLGDLKQLAAAAVTAQGWKLQSLTCQAQYCVIRQALSDSEYQVSDYWPEASRAMMQLPLAFPFLQHLYWGVPVFKYGSYDFIHPSSATGHVPGEGQQHVEELLTEEVAQCAFVTAVANAVLQLKCLEVSSISSLPAVWRVDATASATAAAVAAAALSALLDQSGLPHELLPSATAAAFTTLDDYGCWLLHHHPKLRQLHVRAESLNGADCSMSWQRQQRWQQQQLCQCTSSSCKPGKCCRAAELVGLNVSCWEQAFQDADAAHESQLAPAPQVNNSYNSHSRSQLVEFTQRLSHFSSRPASLLMKHISRCQLNIHNHHIDVLADLLRNMKSLKHLEVGMSYHTGCTSGRHTDAPTALLAVVALPGLQSLSLRINGVPGNNPGVRLTGDLLLPLTAAAGGPGSSLTKLKLYGRFVSASEAAGNAAATANGASLVSGRAWCHALLQLDGLQELKIWNQDAKQFLSLPVECLPAGLEVLEGGRLHIMTSAAVDGVVSECSSSVCHKLLPCTAQATHEATLVCPQLQTLTLFYCHLSSPSMLASNQLHKLTVCDSSWSGGWTAAAAAWPGLNQLIWMRPGKSSHSSSSSIALSESREEAVTSVECLALMRSNLYIKLWDCFDVFRQLRSFVLSNHPVNLQLIDNCGAELQQVQQSGRAYAWHSKPGRSLLVRCSSLGNMRPSRTPQQGQFMQQQQHSEQQALEAADSPDRGGDGCH